MCKAYIVWHYIGHTGSVEIAWWKVIDLPIHWLWNDRILHVTATEFEIDVERRTG